MKVLYLISGVGPPSGWGTEYIQDLIFELSKKNVQATILNPVLSHTPSDLRDWSRKVEEKYNVKIINFNSPNFLKKNFILHLLTLPFITTIKSFNLLRKERFDLVHEFSSTPVILVRALILKLFFNVPTIFTHSVYNNTILGNFRWFKFFDFAKKYVIQSKEIIEILERLKVEKNKITLIYPNIDIKKFQNKISKSSARQILKLPSDKFILSYFGSLTTEKGIQDLLKSIPVIDKKITENILIVLYIIWKGSNEHRKFQAQLRNLNLSRVLLREQYIDIPTVLGASDVILLPQRTGMGTTIPPISLLEALIADKKIIATKIIGVKEWMHKGNNTLVPPANPKLLAKAIEDMYLQSEIVDDSVNYQDVLGLKKVLEKYHKLYLEVTKG